MVYIIIKENSKMARHTVFCPNCGYRLDNQPDNNLVRCPKCKERFSTGRGKYIRIQMVAPSQLNYEID